LAVDNPLDDPESNLKLILNIIDIFFSAIFVLELILKVISLGFLYNHASNDNAYIRNSWNVLDILVVAVKRKRNKIFLKLNKKKKKNINLFRIQKIYF
jgi:voltage-dependent calcium channel T type alpha-1H